MKRLPPQPCERIDRTQRVSFKWHGRWYSGFGGDTLASAMLANDVTPVARSFKYGRRRGIMAAGTEEPNALVTLEGGSGHHTPNVRATEAELYEEMQARTDSGVPSLKHDLRAWLKPLHRFLSAGFYYKTFKAPKSGWPWYEKGLRRFSGFSGAPTEPDAEHYDQQYHHTDIAVVGSGPAGMAAALAAAQGGARVLLLDERSALGGEMVSDCVTESRAGQWFEATRQALAEHANITLLTRTTAYALHDYNLLLALERRQDHLALPARKPEQSRQRSHHIRARQVILATGSHERPMMFANNDLPGIMLATAVRRYLHEYAVLCGDEVVIAGNNDSIYALASELLDAGVRPVVVDSRDSGFDTRALQERGAVVRKSHAVIEAVGRDRVSGARIAQVRQTGTRWDCITLPETLPCNLIALSGGFSPVVHLDCHTGSKPVFSGEWQAFMPACDRPNRWVAGSVNAFPDWAGCRDDGLYAAARALEALGLNPSAPATRPQRTTLNTGPFVCLSHKRDKTFLDMQNDVKASDIEQAIRENYRSIEHIKRYTALGFGTDQGKTGNVNGIAVAASVTGIPMEQIGTTTFRPMYTPVTMGALAGEETGLLYDPQRFTPMQTSHQQQGAAFEVVGQWMRPWYFPHGDEDMHAAVARECRAARSALAMMDASTLGKIDIQGPDARELLARVYTNAWAKLAPGKCRYGLMCDENGMIIDDGVTACISDTHFVMTTTTGGAASVYAHLERWHQTEWPALKVYFTSVTDHWSTTAVVGPKARRLMEKVCSDIDFSADAFPFMDWREGTVLGVPARIMRISFSGELSYEINVAANYGRHIWDQVHAIGQEWGITPYGTESMHVLRAEKGYIIVGQDTDGSITPYDAGMSWAVARNKPYPFIGLRSLSRSDTSRPDRKQLVGLLTEAPDTVLPEGCQLVRHPTDTVMIGHVTSSYLSPTLERSIALAVVRNGFALQGETIYARPVSGAVIPVVIRDTTFYDAGKEQLDGER